MLVPGSGSFEDHLLDVYCVVANGVKDAGAVSAANGINITFDHVFFQAEDGIRDATVTVVQTCALPISSVSEAQFSCFGRCSGHTSAQPVHASSEDRKSTRLNSSHGSISYAVFCLK